MPTPEFKKPKRITDPKLLERFLRTRVDPATLDLVLKRMNSSWGSDEARLVVTKQDHDDFRAFLGNNPEIRSTGRTKLEVMGRFLQLWGTRFRIRIVETI